MRFQMSRRGGSWVVLLAVGVLCGGCGGKNEGGDTVPSPPRALVDKSFHPPATARPSGTTAGAANDASTVPAGK